MGQIQKTDNNPLDPNGHIRFPAVAAMSIPGFRLGLARERGVHKKMLIHLSGGIGDNICTEPVIRYALEHNFGNEISIITEEPELFQHLKFKDVFNLKTAPDKLQYWFFESFKQAGDFSYDFLAPPFIHCVDYPSLNMFRCQLPMADKRVILSPTTEQQEKAKALVNPNTDVVLHPGKTWPSRTMPKDWWLDIIHHLIKKECRPVLIGAHVPNEHVERNVLDLDPRGCLDLRNKMSIMETVAVLQRAKVLLTNDSAPLHMASSGDAWIGFMATTRHPDNITHYRAGGYGWRMQNFAKGGHWQQWALCHAQSTDLRMDQVRQSQLRSWLCDPVEISEWAIEKLGCTL